MKSFLFPFRVALLLIGGGLSQLRAAPSPAASDDLVKKGDMLDRKFDAPGALKCYGAAQKIDPNNATLFVRMARQYRHMMSDAKAKEEKLRLGHLALDCSQAALELAPNDPEAHLSVAITYGKLLPFVGSKEQVAATPRIKASADRTLQLNPREDTAWHVLGRWNRALADVSGVKRMLSSAIYGKLPQGTNEEAERCLEKAIELNPNRLMHYIELGRVYAQMGRKEEAKRFINKGLAMANVEKDDSETKARGREALDKLR